ncbi:MAG: hypothetical protein ACRD3L_00515 [Terriglobales bacterium]
MVAQASSHRRGDPQRFVDSGEIVIHRVDSDHRGVILDFLAESVCEPIPEKNTSGRPAGRISVDAAGVEILYSGILFRQVKPLPASAGFYFLHLARAAS